VFQHRLAGVEGLADIAAFQVQGCNIHDNLNGITRYLPAGVSSEEIAQFTETMKRENVVEENRREEVKVRIMEMGKSLAQMADDENVCSFILTGPHFVHQGIWHCKTCKLDNRMGVCGICARTCHAGHDVELKYEADFYCDCGESFEDCQFREVVAEKVEEKRRLGTSQN
jgi:hypothetical protein